MIKMKRSLFFIILAVIVAGGAIVSTHFWKQQAGSKSSGTEKTVYYCPMHPNYTSDRPGTCPICNMTLVKRETPKLEEAPSGAMPGMDMPGQAKQTAVPKVLTVEQLMAMKPGEICLLHKCKMGQCTIAMTPEFARLGQCPHCGEDLGVIVKDAFPQGYTSLQLGAAKQQAIGVRTTPVLKMALTKTIRASGRIAYDPELYQAEEEYLQAIQAFRKAETADSEIKEQAAKLVDSSKIKLRLLGLSDAIVQEVEKAGRPDRSLLYSDPGGKVWLYAPIYEYETPFVHMGDAVEVDVPAISGKKYQGVVRSLDSVVDPMTRSIRVRAQLENPDGTLKPEMYVNATLKTDLGEQLAAPEEAVFMTGEKNIVFVVRENNVFEPREVMLGAKADGFYEIKSGLLESEQVVTSGNFLIDSESRLKSALEGAGGGGGHQHNG